MTHYVQVSCEVKLVTQQELVRDSEALLEEVDYESLLPAAPVLSMLAVTFTYSYRVQAGQEVTHKWLILYSIAYYVTIFTDIIDHSYFTGYSKKFNCWTFISAHLAR